MGKREVLYVQESKIKNALRKILSKKVELFSTDYIISLLTSVAL